MRHLKFTNKWEKCFSGLFALVAAVLSLGGPVVLAEHYAQAGETITSPGFMVVQQQAQLVDKDT